MNAIFRGDIVMDSLTVNDSCVVVFCEYELALVVVGAKHDNSLTITMVAQIFEHVAVPI